MTLRRALIAISSAILFLPVLLVAAPTHASVLTSPIFELDANKPTSLATSGATVWKDLVSGGTLSAALSGTAAYSSDGGGSLQVSGVNGPGGVGFPATTAPTATNPSGDMTLMMWVKFTSWSAGWNIMASRWFSDTAGTGSSDWHFGVYTPGTTPYLNLYTSGLFNQSGVTPLVTNKWYEVGFTLSWSGNLQFYVDGRPDGSVITGATRSASSTSQLWVGDLRTCAGACGMVGNIAKFRIWSSVLSASAIKNDFNNEAGPLGYATTTSVSLASNSPVYRVLDTATASISMPGKVTFYERGKPVPGCRNIVATSSAVCLWKPSVHGPVTLSASYMPTTDTGTLPSSTALQLVPARRAVKR